MHLWLGFNHVGSPSCKGVWELQSVKPGNYFGKHLPVSAIAFPLDPNIHFLNLALIQHTHFPHTQQPKVPSSYYILLKFQDLQVRLRFECGS